MTEPKSRLNKINAVDGVKFSIKSMRHDLDENTMMQDLVEHGVFTLQEADDFRDEIEKLLGSISANATILDMNETTGRDNRRFLPYKKIQTSCTRCQLIIQRYAGRGSCRS